jgi:hypothetical protein
MRAISPKKILNCRENPKLWITDDNWHRPQEKTFSSKMIAQIKRVDGKQQAQEFSLRLKRVIHRKW